MSNPIERLASHGSAPLLAERPQLRAEDVRVAGALESGLRDLLDAKNGFYAFESALHVFPAGNTTGDEMDLARWNSPTLWRTSYRDLAEGCLFFAQDIFGGQFCIRDGAIHTFDPETGATEYLADSMEEWADLILADYEFLTGFPLAHEWQSRHGLLPFGMRLVPKQPFVLQGEFSVENLYALEMVQAMQLRGELAVRIRDLPEGAQVRLEVVD